MSDETGSAAPTGTNAESVTANEQPSMSFAEFLESVPPGELRGVKSLRAFNLSSVGTRQATQAAYLSIPQLSLHCTICNGDRVFRCSQGSRVADGAGVSDIFLLYSCSNCGECQKTFALRAFFPERDSPSGKCMKFGEIQAYGSPTPKRLLRLFGKDSRIFLKGRQCENHGLGIGAFVYYRRVVESHKNQILDQIIEVAKKIAPEMVEKLEEAKIENQFSKAIASVKPAIPQVLLINGHNPLTLLHSALSKGLHADTDEQCLELAHDVRVVLAELADRIGNVLKDEAELNAAISRLMQQ